MSTHHDDRDLLAQALRERAAGMAGSVDLDAVKGRARGIQRRRRAATGLVAAAVIAVAVPVGLNLTDGMRSTAPAPANPAPSVVESGEPTPGPRPTPKGTVALDGASAPRGADPAIGYTSRSVLHLPDGSTTSLERSLSGVAPHQGDGWVGYDWSDGRTYFLDADGAVVEGREGTGTAIQAGGPGLAYTLRATGGRDLVLDSTERGSEPLSATVAGTGELTPVGFVGDTDVVFEVDKGAAGSEVGVTDFEGAPVILDGLVAAQGANDVTGVVSGMTSATDYETCSAVIEVAGGDRKWETCDYQLTTYSPDGRYVLGLPSYFDGLGYDTVAILDASDGSLVADFAVGRNSFITDTVWESDSSALLATYQAGTWHMLRVRPDGTVERAVDPTSEADEMSIPWSFAATP